MSALLLDWLPTQSLLLYPRAVCMLMLAGFMRGAATNLGNCRKACGDCTVRREGCLGIRTLGGGGGATI